MLQRFIVRAKTMGFVLFALCAFVACQGGKSIAVDRGEFAGSVFVDGYAHDYTLYVPQTVVADDEGLPLVISLHGGGGTPQTFAAFTQMRAHADEHGYALLEAEGFNGTWNAGSCCATANTAAVDHVEVIKRMVDAVGDAVPLNRSRVYAAGHSNGGMMAYRLACEGSEWIAAIAAVSAFMMDKNYNRSPPQTIYACDPQRAVPILHIHGLADSCAPFEGGLSTGPAGGMRPAVRDNLAFWAQNNACFTAPSGAYFTNGAARCERYGSCVSGAPVELCTIDGGGHVWPGTGANPTGQVCGGSGTTDLMANEHIWQFFQRYSL